MKLYFGCGLLTVVVLVGCSPIPNPPGPPAETAPAGLTYASNPAVYVLGQPIEANVPSSAGGAVTSYSISPAVPRGLQLDPNTGILSGTPTELHPVSDFTVTAKNSAGSTDVHLTLTVNDLPPSGLRYSANPAAYPRGQPIANNVPSNGGGTVVSYSMTPSLPAGLALDTVTGVISGTPTAVSPLTHYLLTATNSGGSTSITLTITVNDAAPSQLSYSMNPAVYTVGEATVNDVPSNGGGTIVSYAVEPSLPLGLNFDTTTGVISGVPLTMAATRDYRVTGTNSGGSTSVTLTLTVNDAAPDMLTYASNPAVYTIGQPILNNVPSNSGGAVSSYAISPPLPPRLRLDTSTGVIWGVPTELSPATSYTVTATNVSGQATASLVLSVVDLPPARLTYSTNPATYTKGQTIANNVPTSSGGAVVSYAIQPTLPAGLSLDTATGVISGTPSATSAAQQYTVTATNSGGSTSVALALTVNDAAPTMLTYSSNPAVYTIGQPILNNVPSNSGGAVSSYAISPQLPPGLSLDTSTGVISGTPLELSPATSYTVTAMNVSGQATASLALSVIALPPARLSYSTNPATYVRGQGIANNVPSSGGGAVVSYAIQPALPAGLSLDTATGVISGTPSAISTAQQYTVTATNSGGSTSVTLTITVNDLAPTHLIYSSNPSFYTKGEAIVPNTPSNGGGVVVSYAIVPALPAGLTFNTTTGVISGTPKALAAATAYKVTASNSGGSATVLLTITVNEVPPSQLTYSVTDAVYTKGVAISANVPSSSGGAVVSYGIAPALPEGLSLDPSTGVISGTPTALSTTQQYTVTATNSSGSASVTLMITVNDAAPTMLTYSSNPAVYTLGQPILNNVPSNSGGVVSSYTISPPLPPGLSLDTSTGVISGTPTALSATQQYTVTAGNSGGQTTAAITITVIDASPARLTYSTNPATYTKGQTIPNNVPTSSGGAVVSYAISPALPAGLDFNTTTGIISGQPSVVSGTTQYQITAKNASGSTSVQLSITVNDIPPTGLSYSANPATYIENQAIPNNVPSAGGGMVTSYSISPVLPTGLSLNTSTGVISGTPTVVSPTTQYTVTAANSGGVTSVTLTITVKRVASAVSVDSAHECAVVSGAALCWGENTYGELGTGSTTTSDVPVQVSGLNANVTAIAVGTYHSCAVVGGAAWCWGRNYYGQLGDGTGRDSLVPVQVSGLTSGVQAISAGTDFTCALVNGGVKCWGNNTSGQLGNGTTTWSFTPVQVTGLTSGVQAISANEMHACALVNGGAQCWGDNYYGALGNNSSTLMFTTPVHVSGLSSGVTAIAEGPYHGCAIVNGAAWCWGEGANGALGNDSTTNSLVPVQVIGLTSGVQAISSGYHSSCAIVNGGVQCWGYNANGQLGDNSTMDFWTPGPVSGLSSGGQSVSIGSYDACAVMNSGLWCWGYGTNGELGNNSTASSSVPVLVGL